MITLDVVQVEGRHEDGTPYAWRKKNTIANFGSIKAFEAWVDSNAYMLDANVQPFSGSASTLQYCIAYLKKALNEVVVV